MNVRQPFARRSHPVASRPGAQAQIAVRLLNSPKSCSAEPALITESMKLQARQSILVKNNSSSQVEI
jgi:hypothetical protein